MRLMNPPTHSIIETAAFSRRVKELGLSSDELVLIYDAYAAQPDYGEVVKRTGGLRKGRIAKDGAGKRGGYRVFSFYLDPQNPVFLLLVIDKVQDDTLTGAQEAVFKTLITTLKKELRRDG
jgi:hypothetical protein